MLIFKSLCGISLFFSWFFSEHVLLRRCEATWHFCARESTCARLNLSPGEHLRTYTGMMRSTSAFMHAHN